MSRVVGSFEAKTQFSKLLADASKGEKIFITKNGKIIAMLVPSDKTPELTIDEAIERLRNLRKKLIGSRISLSDINEMKNEGRK